MHLPAQVAMPQLTSSEIVTIDTRRTKPRDDAPSVGHGRRSAGWILVARRFLLRPGDAGLPEQFARAPVETEHGAAALGVDGLSDENPPAPHDGGGIAAVRQRHAPGDVLVGAPVEREVLLGGGATAVRSAPSRP